jgi:beta-lactam-binding protein with PASTA domain
VRRARSTLEAQPLATAYVYRPAAPRQKLGVVLKQFPAGGGHLSSGGRVTLVLAKAVHGVIPKLVGLPLDRAKKKLERLNLDVDVKGDDGDGARVVKQWPQRGRAAAPGMKVTLTAKGG